MTWFNLTPFFEENSNSKAARKPKLLDFVLCFRQWYLGVVGPRKKKHDDGTHLMIPPGVTHSDMFRGRNLFKMVDQYKVSWLLHEISRSTCVIFPLVHQRCCNTSLRVGSTGSVVRPILWTNGMMLGSWVFRWHTEKRRWFSDGFWTNYKNLNRPHVKMCFRKGNLPKHGLNFILIWVKSKNDIEQLFFWFFLGSLHWFHQHPPTIKTFVIGAKERFQWL